MPSHERVGDLPVVVALGSVDPGLVSGVLGGHCRFVAAPGEGMRVAWPICEPRCIRRIESQHFDRGADGGMRDAELAHQFSGTAIGGIQ